MSSHKIDTFIYLQWLYVYPLLKIRPEVLIWAAVLWQWGWDQVPLSSTTLCLLPNGWYQVSAVVLDPVFLGLSEVSMRGSASHFTPEWRTFPTSGPQQKGDRVPIGQAPEALSSGCGTQKWCLSTYETHFIPPAPPHTHRSTRKKSPCTQEP